MMSNYDTAYKWVRESVATEIDRKFHCETRDIFQSRLDTMVNLLLNDTKINANDVYILAAIAGEIGNNSYDHNLGNWSDIVGIFFSYEFENDKLTIVLADRGRGILATLKRVKTELENDEEALETAFNERISGRAPESRGNGLKFVKESLKQTNNHLLFISGTGKAELNDKMVVSRTEKITGCLAVITN